MNESVRSMVLGPSVLYGVAAAAVVLTVVRRPVKDFSRAIDEVVRLYLIGIAFQCLHFTEEYVTRFYVRAPEFLGLAPWPSEFFVIFNLSWIALWILAAVGIRSRIRVAFFSLWFFAIAMVANAIAHPLLSVATGGYFPGLITSPFAGIIGAILASRLCKVTEARVSAVRSAGP